jgi:hypothetical protein
MAHGRSMYRKLPFQGGDPRLVAEVVNNLVEGKSNNTGHIDLNTGWATTTTLYDERIGFDSVILLAPLSDSAETDTLPYGEFSKNTDQLAPSSGNTAVVEWTTEHEVNGVYLDGVNTSRIYVRNDGTYKVLFSLQLANSNNDAEYADVWFRVNGTDVSDSAKRFGLPARKSTGDPSHLTGTTSHVLDLNAGDYIEIAGATSSTNVSLEHFTATTTTPYTRPAIPSAQINITYISPSSMDSVYVSARQKGQATISHFANNTSNKQYGYVIIG